MPPTKEEFREVMGRFATGVTVITTRLGQRLHGMTANAVTSVSLEPLLVLVCIDRQADSHDLVQESGVFAVNILSGEQEELSRHFAAQDGENEHEVAPFPHRFAVTGSPILEGCLAYLDCRVAATYPGGDHTIFLGQVEEARLLRNADPLIFFRGRYRHLTR